MPDKNKNIEFQHYLLGMLNDEAKKKIEELIISDDSVYQTLLLQEEALIDAYFSNTLSTSEKENFEAYYTQNSGRQQKVTLLKLLYEEHIPQTASGELIAKQSFLAKLKTGFQFFFLSGKTKYLTSIMGLFLILVFTYSQIATNSLRKQIAQQKIISNFINREDIQVLTPEANSDINNPTKIRILNRTQLILFIFNFDQSKKFTKYQIEIKTSSGRQILLLNNLPIDSTKQKPAVSAFFPAKMFSKGEYLFELNGQNSTSQPEHIKTYKIKIYE